MPPLPCCGRRSRRKRQRKENGLLDALTQLTDTDLLLRYEVDSSPMRSFFLLGRVQLEVVSAFAGRKSTRLKQQ